MKAKIPLLVGGAVGYVLGTRAGRERYEQIKSQAQTIWNNPKVQEGAQKGAWAAQDFAKEKAPVLKDKLGDAGPGSSSSSSGSGTSSSDPVAATTATGMSATDPLGSETGLGGDLDTGPDTGLDSGLDSGLDTGTELDPGLESGTGLGGDLDPDLDTGTDPLSSTPDDRAPFPSSGSGL